MANERLAMGRGAPTHTLASLACAGFGHLFFVRELFIEAVRRNGAAAASPSAYHYF